MTKSSSARFPLAALGRHINYPLDTSLVTEEASEEAENIGGKIFNTSTSDQRTRLRRLKSASPHIVLTVQLQAN